MNSSPICSIQRWLLFYGEMGAGKTHSLRQFVRNLRWTIYSYQPTFSIINEYFTSKKEAIYHVWPVSSAKFRGMMDIGYEDYLQSGNYLFIEWPEKAAGFCQLICLSANQSECWWKQKPSSIEFFRELMWIYFQLDVLLFVLQID